MGKKLGFGCMRLPLLDPNDQNTIDTNTLSKLFDLFLEQGFRYFDTAFFYHNGLSETAIRTCLVQRYSRDSFLLADKMPMIKLTAAEEMEKIFALQLERCGVAYFDYYLLHNLNERNYNKATDFQTFEFLSRKKAEGRIRHLGFSFHGTPELLEQILAAHPEAEFVQLQINYLDWDNPKVQSRRCYEIARRFGREVIIMEPCKGGELSTVPAAAAEQMNAACPGDSPSAWAFRFAAGLEGVIMVLSGMNTQSQVLENTALFDAISPLDATQLQILWKTAAIINASVAVKCTSCRYCIEGCPQEIPIPDLFSVYNRYQRTGLPQLKNSYRMTVRDRSKASDCLGCGLCTEKCPQMLNIPALLQDVAAVMEH